MKGGTGNIVIKNKKASHDYEFLEKFVAGDYSSMGQNKIDQAR